MRRPALVLLAFACLGAVSLSRAMSPKIDRQFLNTAAGEYVALAVAVGRLDPPSMDWQLPSALQTSSLTLSLEEIETRLVQLRARLESGDGPARRRRDLGLQVDALHARVGQLLGRKLTFEDELQRLFGVTMLPGEPSRRDEVLAELDRLLPGNGTLAARLALFDRRFVVPVDRLPGVLDHAVAGCRAATAAHVELPAGEAVTLEFVTGEPWSAFSQYYGGFRSVLRVNTAFPLTVDRALGLACHETYPGHHASNSLRERELVEGRGLHELSVQPLFSPMAFTAEALASAAASVAFSFERRLALERDELFPMAGLDRSEAARYLRVSALVQELEPGIASIAREYLEGRASSAEAATRLEREALMAHGAASLRFMDLYRGYALAYTLGSGLLAVGSGESDQTGQWKRFLEITLAPVPSLQLPPAARAVS